MTLHDLVLNSGIYLIVFVRREDTLNSYVVTSTTIPSLASRRTAKVVNRSLV